VVPFAPEAPFRLYGGRDRDPIEVTLDKVVMAAHRGADPELTYLVPGKIRPVLVVSDAHDDTIGELLALRLARLSRLTEAEQDRVRAQQSPAHFHLDAAAFPGLPEENAAMIGALVRVHRSAIDATSLGSLPSAQLAVVHARIARFYGLDLRELVRDQLEHLARRQARRER
jgi:hypothetical protein